MNLFDVIRLHDDRVVPQASKVHLAVDPGDGSPLQLYHDGAFDDWQARQSRRNFELPFVVSLIQLPERDLWMFAGAYGVASRQWQEERQDWQYVLEPIDVCRPLAARLIVRFTRTGRQSYLLGANFGGQMLVHELRAEPLHLKAFPGFKQIRLSWSELKVIVRQGSPSWHAALSSVAGVYLIADPTDGRLYVGSATGEGGIWGRWSQYLDGHAGNVRLAELVGRAGVERAHAFQLSVLEIADTHASREEVLARETHWKEVLLTRQHGYNAN